MRVKPFPLIAALLALCAIAIPAQEPTPEDRLAAAEAKWSANKPKAYEFTISPRFCCVIRLRGPSLEPLVFRVDNG